ncbi:hypothetical protein [Aeromonas veronii]|uniref:hypothetical protein n=2 Tax=Aeromonadaceae TaxID=84642 RepID=UPI003004AD03
MKWKRGIEKNFMLTNFIRDWWYGEFAVLIEKHRHKNGAQLGTIQAWDDSHFYSDFGDQAIAPI